MTAEYVEFDSQTDAIDYRAKAGGLIFSALSGKTIWFNPTFSASNILYHKVVQGLSGYII